MDLRDYGEFSDADVERIFQAKPEPSWLLRLRLFIEHPRTGDAAVILVCFVCPLILWVLGVV